MQSNNNSANLSWLGKHVFLPFLFTYSVFCSPVQAEQGVLADRIIIGQTTGLTGQVSGSVKESRLGAQAYFDWVNQRGGINGRKIELMTLDDQFDPKTAGSNAKQLIEGKQAPFALFLTRGTPHTEAVFQVAKTAQVPLVAPSTGAAVLHQPAHKLLFNVRAKYQEEVELIIRHLSSVGLKRVALVYADDSFGKDVLEGYQRSVKQKQLNEILFSFDRSKPDIDALVKKIDASGAPAIILAASGTTTVGVIKKLRALGNNSQIAVLSNNSSESFIQDLGGLAHGIMVSQIMPSPNSTITPLAKELQAALVGRNQKPSYATMEGFVAAKVLVEGLKRGGKNLTRASFVAGLESMKEVDFGGISVGYGPNDRTGSRYVELSMINKEGRFIK